MKLIIIDSVTFHFRHDFEDMRLRSRLLHSMAQSLISIAEKKQIAVCSVHYFEIIMNVGRSYESDDHTGGR